MHAKEDFAMYNNIIAFAEDFTNPAFLNLLRK
jgi:hypothetical protein